MNITFQAKPVTLQGKSIKVGGKLSDFRIIKSDLSELSFKDTKGVRIFLSVPSLDTGVCSMEVEKFMEYMKNYDDVTCYSISMDLPFALDRWCQAKENDNVVTASDYKYHEFAKATGTLVEDLVLLTRACFVVDENDIVQYAEYVSEITKEPNYDAVLNAVGKLTGK